MFSGASLNTMTTLQGGGSAAAPSAQVPSSVSGGLNFFQNYLDMLTANARANTDASSALAAENRAWQAQQNAGVMAFNAEQAALNRDWQEYMSNTAHQREVADLRAAGLNPVLSAMGGNGAAVTSGATASGVTSGGAQGQVDTSVNAAMVGLLGSILNGFMSLENQRLTAANNFAIAEVQANASKYGSDMQKYIAANYPSSLPGIINSLFTGAFTGDNKLSSDAFNSIKSGSDSTKKFLEGYTSGKLQPFTNSRNFINMIMDFLGV